MMVYPLHLQPNYKHSVKKEVRNDVITDPPSHVLLKYKPGLICPPKVKGWSIF